MACPILVTTTNPATGETRTKTIDHDKLYDRQWLGKHCWWAMRNGHAVETRPIEKGERTQ